MNSRFSDSNSKRRLLLVLVIVSLPILLAVAPVITAGEDEISLTVKLVGVLPEHTLHITGILSYPGGEEMIHTSRPSNEDTLKLTFKLKLNMTRVNSEIEMLRQYGIGQYAAIQIHIYAVSPDGKTCITNIVYTTLDYYLDKTHDLQQAKKLAMENPLALLHAKRITLTGNHVQPCTYLNDKWDNIIRNRETTNKPRTITTHEYKTKEEMPSSISCRVAFDTISHADLWNATENPPDIWMNRVIVETDDPNTDPDGVKKELWKQFASRFSLSYYVPRDGCTADNAVNAVVSEKTMTEAGIYKMDDFVRKLLDIAYPDPSGPSVSWAHTNTPDKIVDGFWAPLLTLRFEPEDSDPPPKYPRMTLSLTRVDLNYDERGITFLGKLIVGTNEYRIDLDQWMLSIQANDVDSGKAIGFIYTYFAIRFKFDGIYITYKVEQVHLNESEDPIGYGDYWKVTPEFIFIPVYDILVNYNDNFIKHLIDDYENPSNYITNVLLESVEKLTSYLPAPGESNTTVSKKIKIYDKYLKGQNIFVYVDTNMNSSIEKRDLSWLMSLLLSQAVQGLRFFSEASALRAVSTIAGESLQFSFISLNSRAIAVSLELQYHSEARAWVGVFKTTVPPQYLDNEYIDNNVYPTMFSYEVHIDVISGSQPSPP